MSRAKGLVDQIMRLGYYTVQYSEHHFRIQDAVDFWPSTEKWFDRKGYKYESKGRGVDELIAYLKTHYPLDSEGKIIGQ